MGSHGRLLLMLTLCTALPVALTAPASSSVPLPAARMEPHDFRGHGLTCRSCHRSPGVKIGGELVKSVSEICGGCHRLPEQSHPVDIGPSMRVPPDLPLDAQGRLTCTTCHDPHRSYLNPLTGKRTLYLRRDGSKRGLCISCHRK